MRDGKYFYGDRKLKFAPLSVVLLSNYFGLCLSELLRQIPSYRKEGNILFNDAVNTFYMGSDCQRKNPLPPLHGLLFLISSKGSFIYITPQTGQYIHGLSYTSCTALAGKEKHE